MGGGTRILRVLDRDYPYALRELPSPPDPLCLRGELLPLPGVAIVGTRAASPEATAYASRLAGWLAGEGVMVWSGGAFGIDAAAHRGALQSGGVSVVVVGTGLDHCYPPEHAGLYDEIVRTGGAIVSPFDLSQHATLTTFPQRNAVLAAMTQATVLVQAPLKSGARSTARWARRLARPLFVVPAAPWDPLGGGNYAELRLRGIPLIDEEHLLARVRERWLIDARSSTQPDPQRREAIGDDRPPPRTTKASSSSIARLTPPSTPTTASPGSTSLTGRAPSDPGSGRDSSAPVAQYAVLSVASGTPRHVDDFCLLTGFAAGPVHEALLTLTFQAVLVEGPAGWFRMVTAGN